MAQQNSAKMFLLPIPIPGQLFRQAIIHSPQKRQTMPALLLLLLVSLSLLKIRLLNCHIAVLRLIFRERSKKRTTIGGVKVGLTTIKKQRIKEALKKQMG